MVSILQGAKNILGGKSFDASPPEFADNRVERVDQAKVVWYQWEYELSTDSKKAFGFSALVPSAATSALLNKSTSYDISNHIENITYTKSMDGGAGSFSIVLHNSFDWSRYMRPGQWITVYLTGDGDLPLPNDSSTETNKIPGLDKFKSMGTKLLSNIDSPLLPVPPVPLPKGPTPSEIDGYKRKRRVLGVISRVGIRSSTSADGAVEISYVVSGRDYGTIYDETTLWFNANNAERQSFEVAINAISKNLERNLSALLDKWHDIFLAPHLIQGLDSVTNIKSFFPEQWIMPSKLISDLNLSLDPRGKGCFGDIVGLKEFSATLFESPDPNPLAGLEGECWSRLKNLSQPGFHELFTELSDNGAPKIYFRPVPWALDKSRYPNLGNAMLLYKELASGQDVQPPFPTGTVLSSLVSVGAKALSSAVGIGSSGDQRLNHTVSITAKEVENFDVGPDYHSRYNFFLIDVSKSGQDQSNSFTTIQSALAPALAALYPLRDENDIKRHGFKPMIFNVNNFQISNKNLFKESLFPNDPSSEFIFECNEMMRDFHANAEDLYSGSLTMAGRPDVKIGKVIVTDKSFSAIDDMVFYIEGYTDSFTINGDGTTSWMQTINITRGIQKTALVGGNTKDRQPTKTETFHSFNKSQAPADGGTLGAIKKKIQNPLG